MEAPNEESLFAHDSPRIRPPRPQKSSMSSSAAPEGRARGLGPRRRHDPAIARPPGSYNDEDGWTKQQLTTAQW